MTNRRRGQNEGSIFQRKDGRWCAVLNLGRRHGKRRRSYLYGSTAEQVRKELTQRLARLDKGEPQLNSNTTIKAYSEQWLETISQDLKARTISSYRQLLDCHILPAFGGRRMDIGRIEIKRFLTEKRKGGLSKNTVRLIRACLSAMLAEAVDDGLVMMNAAANLSRRSGRKRSDSISLSDRVKAIRRRARGCTAA